MKYQKWVSENTPKSYTISLMTLLKELKVKYEMSFRIKEPSIRERLSRKPAQVFSYLNFYFEEIRYEIPEELRFTVEFIPKPIGSICVFNPSVLGSLTPTLRDECNLLAGVAAQDNAQMFINVVYQKTRLTPIQVEMPEPAVIIPTAAILDPVILLVNADMETFVSIRPVFVSELKELMESLQALI